MPTRPSRVTAAVAMNIAEEDRLPHKKSSDAAELLIPDARSPPGARHDGRRSKVEDTSQVRRQV